VVAFEGAHLAAPSPEVAWGLIAQEAFPRWVHLLVTAALTGLLMLGAPTGWWRLAGVGPPPSSPGVRFALLSAALVPLFWLLRTYEDTPDAATWVRFAPDGTFFPREPLATWLQHLFWLGPGRLLANPREALALLSCLAGAVSVFCLLWLSRLLGRERAWIFFTLTATAYGSFQLFFGHVETYPLLVAAQFGYLLLSLLALRGIVQPAIPALAFGLALALHLSAVWLAPSLLALLLLLRHARPSALSGRNLLVTGAATGVFPLVTFAIMLRARPGGRPSLLLDALWESLKLGEGFLSPGELLSGAHLLAIVNEYALIAPIGAFLVITAPLLGSLGGAGADPDIRFLAAASGPLVLYSVLWRPGLGPYWDWDLFAQVSGPLTLLGGLLLIRAVTAPPVLTHSAVLLLAASLAHGLPLIVAHTRSEHFVDVKRPDQPEVTVPPALRLVDRLDAGNPTDEAAHGYRVVGEGRRVKSRVGQAANPGIRSAGPALLWDDGWEHRGAEEFTVRVTPGIPLAVFKRIDASFGNQVVAVSANGRQLGEWQVPGRRGGTYLTVRFDLPAEAVETPTLRLRFTAVGDRGITSFYYWFYQPAGEP
jgi:hypothetical protein